MRILIISAVSMLAIASCKKSGGDVGGSVITPPAPVPDKEYTFESSPAWADEFDYTGAPDPNNWTYDLGDHGWGNNELQNYTSAASNVQVKDGVLTITAIKETSGSKDYSSTRLVSRGKRDFTYGRVEVKAKLPSGKGTWPAIWMLPTGATYGDWPKSGEIDIMEHVGYDPNVVHFSIHSQAYNHVQGTQKTATRSVPTAMSEFHLYRVDWTPKDVRGFFDGVQVFSFANDGKGFATWPFDKPFHLLLNVAVGGNWGGQQGVDPTVFPAAMVVDYVRMYKLVP
ncbi:MAG: glycoside hydrolase family 16 protein [Chitinophagaceae bacterium]